MTTQNAPIWAIVSAQSLFEHDELAGDQYADVLYHLTFNGETAGNLRVTHFEGCVNTQVQFVEAHAGNDGAYITYLALRALYENQEQARERTGGSEDFEFVVEAFEFVGSYLEFTY